MSTKLAEEHKGCHRCSFCFDKNINVRTNELFIKFFVLYLFLIISLKFYLYRLNGPHLMCLYFSNSPILSKSQPVPISFFYVKCAHHFLFFLFFFFCFHFFLLKIRSTRRFEYSSFSWPTMGSMEFTYCNAISYTITWRNPSITISNGSYCKSHCYRTRR